MREVNMEITISKPTAVNFTKEDILLRIIDPVNKRVTVTTQYYNEEESSDQYTVVIDGENYELLMSESPEFALGKPANDFRIEDLWYMIDKVRLVGDKYL